MKIVQEDLQRLRELRPIDDDFMRCMFKDNIPLAELVLRIITDRQDLTITGCETQKDMKRLAGARSTCLDAYGTDSVGKRYDLELQRQEKGQACTGQDITPACWIKGDAGLMIPYYAIAS